MRYFSSFLIISITLLFISCSGGSESSATSSNVVKATGTAGENGANYTLQGTINIAWKEPVFQNLITVSNFKLHVGSSSYATGYSTSATIDTDSTTHLTSVDNVDIPFAFLVTVPYSSKSRTCSISFDYELGGDTKSSSISCELPAVTDTSGDGDGSGTTGIEKIDETSTALYTSQNIYFTGQVKKSGSTMSGVKVDYAILTPTYINSSSANGTLTTDKNGIFTLNLATNQNPLQETRNIAVVFSYEGSSYVWKLTQAASPEPAEFELTSIYKQITTSKSASSVRYIGTLKSGNTGVSNQNISYAVTPSDASTTPTGTVKTDEFGNFSLNLPITQNNTGASREVNVAFTYQTSNDSWTITQSSQEETRTYTINIPVVSEVLAVGGTHEYIGSLRDESNSPVANVAVDFSILAPSYVSSATSGTVTTDGNGNFSLNVTFLQNGATTARSIPMVFAYNNAVTPITVTQKAALSDYVITSIFSQKSAAKSASTVRYIGVLKSDDFSVASKTINYNIVPANAVTSASSGTVTTDEFGNFNLDVTLAQNDTGADRDINVVFTFQSVSYTWKINQSSQDDVITYAITIPTQPEVYANGGVYDFVGILTNATTKQPVSNTVVNYDILAPSYVFTANEGTTTTNEYGRFKLQIAFQANIGTADRTIPIVFTYRNVAQSLDVLQSISPLTSPYDFKKFDATTTTIYSYQTDVLMFGQLTSNGSFLPNTEFTWSSYPSGATSVNSGTLTTDEYGNFTLPLTVLENPTTSARTIGIMLQYQDYVEIWNITQDYNNPPYEMTLPSAPNISQGGGSYTYTGKLTQNGVPFVGQNVIYEVIDANTVTSTSTGTLNTDANGDFTLNVTYNANTTSNERTIRIQFRYGDVFKYLTLTQEG